MVEEGGGRAEGAGDHCPKKRLEKSWEPEPLGPRGRGQYVDFLLGTVWCGKGQGDEETAKARFILELEPTGHGDGAGEEEQGERGIRGDVWVHPRGAWCCLLADFQSGRPEKASSLGRVVEHPQVHQQDGCLHQA